MELTLGIISDEETWRLLHAVLVRLSSASRLKMAVRKVLFELHDSAMPLYIVGIGPRVEEYGVRPKSIDMIFIFLDRVDQEVFDELKFVIKRNGRLMVVDDVTDEESLEIGESGMRERKLLLAAQIIHMLSKYLSIGKKFVVKILKSINMENINELIERYYLVSRSERI